MYTFPPQALPSSWSLGRPQTPFMPVCFSPVTRIDHGAECSGQNSNADIK